MSTRHLLLIAVAVVAGLPVLVVVGLLAGWIAGPAAAIVVAVAAVALVRARADREPATGLEEVPVTPERQPRLHNVVEGLCSTHGFATPRLYVVDTPAANAAVAGRSADRARLVVTSGLLEACDLLALEAVMANLLARGRDTDLGAATTVAGLLAVVPVGGLRRRLLGRILEDQARIRGDLAAVRTTRYPPGLITALDTLRARDTSVPGVRQTADHLWLVAASGTAEADTPIDQRITILREL